MLSLDHVSIVVTDLDRSTRFYEEMFGLERVPRPAFSIPGTWLACGPLQIHLVLNAEGTFRTRPGIDNGDVHFAFRTDDFDGVLARLTGRGFDEHAPADAANHLYVLRNGRAGFPQLYLLDPDRNIIEINGAPRRA
ncbi:VOC family protein [Kaistia adipata]|uniref:VOC family protein n=1 Tax=Kaistia adipata TaxID=166954 RepID=UPI0003FC3E26|nr:VOC family protein [Kaistia adipata]